MTGITLQLVFIWTKYAVDMIGQTANHLQQASFSRGLEEGDSGFNQMTGAVKFMTLRKIAPAFFGCFYRKVSIEIAVFALGGGDQFDYLVGGFFQFGVRLLAQRPGYRFQPFGDVAVLKHHPVKFTLLKSGGNAKVFNRMAGFRFWDTIVQGIPLIRNHHVADQLLVLTEERIADRQFMQIDFRNVHLVLLKAVHDADAGR